MPRPTSPEVVPTDSDRCACSYRPIPVVSAQKLDGAPVLWYVVCPACNTRACGDSRYAALKAWRARDRWKKQETEGGRRR